MYQKWEWYKVSAFLLTGKEIVKNMIEKKYFGESKNIEFKREILVNHEKFLKDIIAFSNSTGGKVILGVEDKTHIVYGIGEQSPFKLSDTVSNMISDACAPTCRNEAIAEAFHYMHIVEAWGTGIPRIINRCREYGLPEPLFEEFGDGFKVTMFRKVSNVIENMGNTLEKVSNTIEKMCNTTKKVSSSDQKMSNAFEKYLPLFNEAELTEKFIINIKKVFAECGTGVPFGQANVMEWLKCSKSKAINVMNAMKAAKVITKVTGFGVGRYEFIEL